MIITGENQLNAPVEKVWDALLDPRVLVATIPGCSELTETAPHTYAMTVSAGVAAIRGTYSGSCALSDLVKHESLVMKLQGAGAPGTIGATVQVRFAAEGGSTRLSYEADAVVGGMIGGVGQRMLTSVSKRMAAEFFGNVERAISGELATSASPQHATEAAAAVVPAAGQTFEAPRAARSDSNDEGSRKADLTSMLVGGGLVLAGVIVGGIIGRRTR